jgi:hypothetical protein
MKTLLEAIKQYPEEFIDTCLHRADTTPSEYNKVNHSFMAHWVKMGMWGLVSDLLVDPLYRKPLEGVVFCLNMDYDYSIKSKIIELFEGGKLV